jgi:hypothetical protein
MSDEKRESVELLRSKAGDGGRPNQTQDAPVRQTRDGAAVRNSQTARAMDRWFDTQLNKLYAEVVSEPLPKEFLELVEKLREKTPE